MNKILSRGLSVMLVLAMLLSCVAITTSADTKFTYRANKNGTGAHSTYSGGKYYNHLTQLSLTGDGRTDALAVALSQLGYQESDSSSSLSGTASGSSNNTEFCRNTTGYNGYAWCAAFCSWVLYQSRVSNHNLESDMYRSHSGSSSYYWCEIYCPYWVTALSNAGYYRKGAYHGGNYTPQSGDLIFFYNSSLSEVGHIGMVVYTQGSTVYTIEGNTSDSAGVEANGGGVYFKSYNLNYSRIAGYGALPYQSNANVQKIDYSGANPTAGLWITNTTKYVYADEACTTRATYTDGVNCNIPKYTMFEAYGVTSNKKALKVRYDGVTGYVAINTDRVIQLTSTSSSDEQISVSGNVAKDKSYTTSLLYRQGGEDVNWAYDETKAISYDDENKKSLTDGLIASSGDYANAAWAGLHANTPDASAKGYAWVNVDLGNIYDVTNCKIYVPIKDLGADAGVTTPSSVSFWGSKDGVNYTEIGTAAVASVNECTSVMSLACDAKVRYIEARISSYGWIFVSEIAVVGTLSTNNDAPIVPDIQEGQIPSDAVGKVTIDILKLNQGLVGEDSVIITDLNMDFHNAWAYNMLLKPVAGQEGVYELIDTVQGLGSTPQFNVPTSNGMIILAVHSAGGDNATGFDRCVTAYSIGIGSKLKLFGIDLNNGKFTYSNPMVYVTDLIPNDNNSGEDNSDSDNNSSEIIDESSDIIDDSSDVIDDSSDIIDDSSDVIDDSSDVVEESSDVVEESSDVVEESSDVVEDSSDVNDESSDTSEDTSSDISEGDTSDDDEEDVKTGDINENGKIDMTDYILLKRAYFGTYDFNDRQNKAGDINANGKIDMTDYILLKRIYFGTYKI